MMSRVYRDQAFGLGVTIYRDGFLVVQLLNLTWEVSW